MYNSIIVFIVTILNTTTKKFIMDHWIKQKVQDNFESNENEKWNPFFISIYFADKNNTFTWIHSAVGGRVISER